jgi:helicase MOV-10
MPACPILIAFGSCTIGACGYNHDVHVCTTCGVVSTSKEWHDAHLRGKQHRKKSSARGPPAAGSIHCATCDVYCTPTQYRNHVSSIKHAQKARSLAFMSVLEEASKDKHGITITYEEDGLDFGIVGLRGAKPLVVAIRSLVPHSTVSLLDVKISSNSSSSPYV